MRLPKFLRNTSLVVGAIISLAIICCAIFAPYIATHGIEQMDMRNRFAGPTLTHWLGTDNFGRDLWSRLVFGARISLTISIISVAGSAVVGTVVGLAAGDDAAGVPRRALDDPRHDVLQAAEDGLALLLGLGDAEAFVVADRRATPGAELVGHGCL